MGQSLPSISGHELIRVLETDGWIAGRRTTHGIMMTKKFPDRTRVTIIPTKDKAMPEGTLAAILGPKQTCIGREGFLALLGKKSK
jgi:predicted RNA binding protein YcfA (HicA-like mRNA interferase family)